MPGQDVRLITYASLVEWTERRYSVGLRHILRLNDGREHVLLNDRGWSGTRLPDDRLELETVELSARTAVGPDEPIDGQTWEELDRDNWSWIAEVLQKAGETMTVDDVSRLPHDVVLDERLKAVIA